MKYNHVLKVRVKFNKTVVQKLIDVMAFLHRSLSLISFYAAKARGQTRVEIRMQSSLQKVPDAVRLQKLTVKEN